MTNKAVPSTAVMKVASLGTHGQPISPEHLGGGTFYPASEETAKDELVICVPPSSRAEGYCTPHALHSRHYGTFAALFLQRPISPKP